MEECTHSVCSSHEKPFLEQQLPVECWPLRVHPFYSSPSQMYGARLPQIVVSRSSDQNFSDT